MWLSLGIDFIINVVVTTWILVSRSNNDGKEVVFSLSGGSHTGTTVLMIIFWVIFVIHLIFCIARSSAQHGNIKNQLRSYKDSEGVPTPGGYAAPNGIKAGEFVGTDSSIPTSTNILEISRKFMAGSISDEMMSKLLNNQLSSSEKKTLIDNRLDNREFRILISKLDLPNKSEIKKSRLQLEAFVRFVNRINSDIERDALKIDRKSGEQIRSIFR